MKVLIVAEHNNNELLPATLHTVNAANQIGSSDLIVIGSDCQNVIKSSTKIKGISKVLSCDNEIYKNPLAENISTLIKSIAEDYSHILFSNTANGKNIAPRLAALLDVMIIPDIIEIIDDETFKRPIYAGNAIATVQSSDATKVITVRGTAFDKAEATGGSAEVSDVAAGDNSGKSEFVKAELSKSDRPELTSANIIISGGRGMGNGENFALVDAVADKLGAAVGASRAAVDAGFVPNDYQVGQTGKIVAPELYIAVGISGAIQHLAGMKDSKIIVAINKDEEAPIFQVADYGLVADLFEALPALEKAL